MKLKHRGKGKIIKWVSITKYKYVGKVEIEGEIWYKARISRLNEWYNYYSDIKEAAKAVDIKLIENGFEPINILKKQKSSLL